MAFIAFDINSRNVFLDTREGSQITDVLVWDQRTKEVTVFIESNRTTCETEYGEPDWSKAEHGVRTFHQERLIVHAANVPDEESIPTVAELLTIAAKVIVGTDGEVSRN